MASSSLIWANPKLEDGHSFQNSHRTGSMSDIKQLRLEQQWGGMTGNNVAVRGALIFHSPTIS